MQDTRRRLSRANVGGSSVLLCGFDADFVYSPSPFLVDVGAWAWGLGALTGNDDNEIGSVSIFVSVW